MTNEKCPQGLGRARKKEVGVRLHKALDTMLKCVWLFLRQQGAIGDIEHRWDMVRFSFYKEASGCREDWLRGKGIRKMIWKTCNDPQYRN